MLMDLKMSMAQAIMRAVRSVDAGRREMLTYIEREMLPSGSGIDNGTRVIAEQCSDSKIVLKVDYHEMNEVGYYTGWSNYRVIVEATFFGIDVKVTGRGKETTKEYLANVFFDEMCREVRITRESLITPIQISYIKQEDQPA